MTQRLNPYVNFRGEASAAIDFYHSVFGGEITSRMIFSDMGVSDVPEEQDWIMHAQLETPHGMWLMVADVPSRMEGDMSARGSIMISLSGTDDADLRGYWDALSAGGAITYPLETAPWGDTFGQLTDRFGVAWMWNIAGPGGGVGEPAGA